MALQQFSGQSNAAAFALVDTPSHAYAAGARRLRKAEHPAKVARHAAGGLGQAIAKLAASDIVSSLALPAFMAAGAVVGTIVAKSRNKKRKEPATSTLVAQTPSKTAEEAEAGEASMYRVAEANGMRKKKAAGRYEEETAQDRVFNWLGRSPKPSSDCFQTLHKFFPGAMPGAAVHLRSKSVLEERFAFNPDNTLLGTSFCPDEINNQKLDLATVMRDYWGKVFPMGGIGGAPYVGETGFKAFSSHVAENGNIIIVFGPHVGISEAGEVGEYLRAGQSKHSTACGAVIGAYKASLQSKDGAPQAEDDLYDMQMDEIKREFAAHAGDISKTENPMASCAYRAYEMVKDRILKIVNTDFGPGNLVLIGGIQINMPYPAMDDHFLPLMFEVRKEGNPTLDLMESFFDANTQQDLACSPWAAVTAQREVFAWLTWSPPPVSPMYKTMHKYFPGALPGQAAHERTKQILKRYGFTPENTLMGTSVCPDEINNEKVDLGVLMQEYWGEVFPMGGISGAPFVGKTGFKAFSSHVSQDGNIVIMFGPHVGISEAGEVGSCLRNGQHKHSTACGAVIGAYNACMSGDFTGETPSVAYDKQMDWIKAQIAPHVDSIKRTENPMAGLSHQSYEMVRDKLVSIVNQDFGSGYLCLVGGIQINLPEPMEDHFMPLTFELRRAGKPTLDLIEELREFS